jgi:uncharacterized protein (TIGR02246 family)
MNGSRRVSAFALTVSLMAAASPVCNSEEAGMSSARAAIEAGNARFSEAVARGDIKTIAGLYTQDAIAFPPGGEMVKGRQAIEELWKATIGSGVKGATLKTLDIGESGDLAYESGTLLLTIHPAGKAPATASAKYVVVWQRQPDGAWLVHRDIWNDLPSK